MGLSCSCDDFDPSEHESWWEPGQPSVPPAGARCCECGAHLPVTEKCATILHHDAYEPDDAALDADPEPDEDDHPDMDGHEFDELLDAWRDRHGWNSECDRFERTTRDYRCERCADLADAIEGMGFCMIPPGDLIEQHTEYVNETQEMAPGVARREIVWSQNKAGVWNPRRKMAADKRRAEIIRRWRNAKFWLRHGWKIDLRWKVWHPAQTRVMRALGYQYTYIRHDTATRKSIYRWQRAEKRPPPWEREAAAARGEKP